MRNMRKKPKMRKSQRAFGLAVKRKYTGNESNTVKKNSYIITKNSSIITKYEAPLVSLKQCISFLLSQPRIFFFLSRA